MTVEQVIAERRSVKVYDKSAEISKEELVELLTLAGKAPSAWNLQHWHFHVFHSQASKDALLPIAYNQSQVSDASAVVAILGDIQAQKKVEPVFGPAVEAGFLSQEIKDTLASQIERAYSNPTVARDAAFSNASLGAMQLMLIAKEKGWDSCAIGGFNPQAFVETFNISERYVPVMLIALGKPAQPGRPSSRLSIEELTTWA